MKKIRTLLLCAASVASLALQPAVVRADPGGFGPSLKVPVGNPIANVTSSIVAAVNQNDGELQGHDFDVDFSSWRFATTVRPSALASCADLNSGNLAANAEGVGVIGLTLSTDATRAAGPMVHTTGQVSQPGPATFSGGIAFLRYDSASSTATLCGLAATINQRIPVADRQVMFQLQLVLDQTTANLWHLRWNFFTVPGAPKGNRSILDNADYVNGHVSILSQYLQLNGYTGGNYNTSPSGRKVALPFSITPPKVGTYTMTSSFRPCIKSGSDPCASAGTPATPSVDVHIATFPNGYHPAGRFTAPLPASVFAGATPVILKWNPPGSVGLTDTVRGFEIVVAHPDPDPNDSGKFYSTRVITDPNDAGYDELHPPCVQNPDGSTECSLELDFPLKTADGSLLPFDGPYSAALITLFNDGHRSDGKCDDGTINGSVPPCADGSTPALTDTKGYDSVQFLLRPRHWPQVYRQVTFGSNGPVLAYVLCVDYAGHAFEFLAWHPDGSLFVLGQGVSQTVAGVDGTGGVVAWVNQDATFLLQATTTLTSSNGFFERSSSSDRSKTTFNQFQGAKF